MKCSERGPFGLLRSRRTAAELAAPAPPIAGFGDGCELRDVVTDALAGTTLSEFEAELDWAEMLVSDAGFVCDGEFV